MRRFQSERGFALLTAFSVAVVLLGLIASLYWIMVQRHTLLRKRSEHARNLYLTEAGMNDAIARLRIGGGFPPGIDPVTGRNYCLNVSTGAVTSLGVGLCGGVCTPPQIRVCVSNNLSGRNQIDVTANF